MTIRTRSFLRFFMLRQALIPLSTVRWSYLESDGWIDYLDVYVFGFRVARLQERTK